ncbi:MAG: hypothetical protein QME66_08285 [Candidatus Eisenbacteria bacterium]|nr:hypothetical protein [Candidatus Eisenbacteria bacterium]
MNREIEMVKELVERRRNGTGIDAVMAEIEATHLKDGKRGRWIDVSRGSKSDMRASVLRRHGYTRVSGAPDVGGVALFETNEENYQRRQKAKQQEALDRYQAGRKASGDMMDKEATKLRGVHPIGSDGVTDFDKKFRPKGEKVAIPKPGEEE